MTIEAIQSAVSKNVKLIAMKGIFFSFFDEWWKLLFSKGIVHTDKTINQIIEIFYNNFFNKLTWAKKLVYDVVKSLQEVTDYNVLNTIDFTKYGIAVQQTNGDTWWIMLPSTRGTHDIKNIFSHIKNKNKITGNIKVYVFETDRYVADLESNLSSPTAPIISDTTTSSTTENTEITAT